MVRHVGVYQLPCHDSCKEILALFYHPWELIGVNVRLLDVEDPEYTLSEPSQEV
jgi:hypothetical protein